MLTASIISCWRLCAAPLLGLGGHEAPSSSTGLIPDILSVAERRPSPPLGGVAGTSLPTSDMGHAGKRSRHTVTDSLPAHSSSKATKAPDCFGGA